MHNIYYYTIIFNMCRFICALSCCHILKFLFLGCELTTVNLTGRCLPGRATTIHMAIVGWLYRPHPLDPPSTPSVCLTLAVSMARLPLAASPARTPCPSPSRMACAVAGRWPDQVFHSLNTKGLEFWASLSYNVCLGC